eukprot:CAMPEP_0171472106 /NCGR_PEP_ID=MMETSP0946-20130122/1093_1 /TAXON_ID=109269 /ORGANISM="Vaucheria litorea, Strain CCMP2940" /LENGTH=66 /DNA_ID=CAMNT_0012001705 /DNA_START=600 /DNA_END=800 /DNA_ORIENTATION=-
MRMKSAWTRGDSSAISRHKEERVAGTKTSSTRAGVAVVLGVGDAPGVVGHEQGRMKDQSEEVVDGF